MAHCRVGLTCRPDARGWERLVSVLTEVVFNAHLMKFHQLVLLAFVAETEGARGVELFACCLCTRLESPHTGVEPDDRRTCVRVAQISTSTCSVETLAGAADTAGSVDDIGPAARFNNPRGLAHSPDGTKVLVPDLAAFVVRQIDVGTRQVTTLAGTAGASGTADGIGAAARFHMISSVACSPDGTKALVADLGNHALRQIDLSTHHVTTVAGLPNRGQGTVDGIGTAAAFSGLRGVAYSPDGTSALVADTNNHAIRHVDLSTSEVTTLAGIAGTSGSADGIGSAARFYVPWRVAISPDGTKALVVEYDNKLVRQIDLATRQVTTIAGTAGASGNVDGIGAAARFRGPVAVAYAPDGTKALVADHNKIRQIDLGTHEVATLAGTGVAGSADGVCSVATFKSPYGVSYSPDGTQALVGDASSHLVRIIYLPIVLGICTRPTTAGYAFDSVSETNLDLSAGAFDVTGIVCATGYVGTAVVTACTSAGAYSVSGCTESICTRPATVGYDFANVFETLSGSTFAVEGLVCSTGYTGTATATVCNDNGAYTVSGCTATVCTRPTTAGYAFDSVSETNLDLSAGAFDVTGIVCATGYVGTAVVTACTSAGAYSVSGCTESICTQIQQRFTGTAPADQAACEDAGCSYIAGEPGIVGFCEDGTTATGSKDSSCYEGVVGACSDPMQRIDCSEAGQRQFMATQFGETGEQAANWRGRVAICCALPVAIDCSSPAVRQMVTVCDTMGVRNCTC